MMNNPFPIQRYITAGNRVHLVGIGGVSMCPLAEILQGMGLVVQGSDIANSASVQHLRTLGIPVAIASDFNPGSCPSLNLQLAMSMGYVKYRMTPEEILTAVTINAACSCGLEEKVGTLEVGKQADIVIWNAPDMEMLVYRFGSNLAKTVIKRGEVV